jgi:hypothetical protein
MKQTPGDVQYISNFVRSMYNQVLYVSHRRVSLWARRCAPRPPGRDAQADRQTILIDDRIDFGTQSPTRTADA